MSEEKLLTCVAEIILNEKSEIIACEKYIFSRKSAVGEIFVRDSVYYEVIKCTITHGEQNCALIETLVKVKDIKR